MVHVFPSPTAAQVCGVPWQSWHASHSQWHGGACDGFVRMVEEVDSDPAHRDTAMRYWTEKDVPFYYGLARTFPLADRWFCSCLGPTFPNRRFLIAGTAHGLIDDLPFGMFDYPKNGTVFDMLSATGISWANYHTVLKRHVFGRRLLGSPGLRIFRWFGLILSGLLPTLKEAVVGNLQFTADLYPLGFFRSLAHLRSIEAFWQDAKNGTLPQLCIVDPDFDCFSEESPQNIQCGEAFAAAVINAVMAGPLWPKTLLVWTYDEHGGYFDHVSPPEAVSPGDRLGHSLMDAAPPVRWLLKRLGKWNVIIELDLGKKGYTRYGFRVPTVFISPYARRGHVTSKIYDHTSILKLIERKWNLPPLTERDAGAADPLDDMLDLGAASPPFEHAPHLPPPAKSWNDVRADPNSCRMACPKQRPKRYPSTR